MNASLNQEVREILFGSSKSRIEKVTNILTGLGVQTAEDFRFLDWKSLESAGVLTDMEVKKIMRYVEKNFPEEYKEHKKKKDEETRIQRETDLLQYKIKFEERLQKEQEKFRNEVEEPRAYDTFHAEARNSDPPPLPAETVAGSCLRIGIGVGIGVGILCWLFYPGVRRSFDDDYGPTFTIIR